jgi:hypothetical protein
MAKEQSRWACGLTRSPWAQPSDRAPERCPPCVDERPWAHRRVALTLRGCLDAGSRSDIGSEGP